MTVWDWFGKGIPNHFIDMHGLQAIPGDFQFGRPFSEGLAAVRTKGKWSYIDCKGKTVIQPKFDWAEQFSEGFPPVGLNQQTANGSSIRFGFIDYTGQLHVQPAYMKVNRFSDGLACVQLCDGSWSYIDHDGHKVLSQYRKAGDFSCGLAPVEINGQLTFIDKQGQVRLAPEQRFSGIFSEGLAVVSP